MSLFVHVQARLRVVTREKNSSLSSPLSSLSTFSPVDGNCHGPSSSLRAILWDLLYVGHVTLWSTSPCHVT